MTMLHNNGSAQGMQDLWLRSTVEEFFSAINWDDRPIEPAPSVSKVDSEPAASSAAHTPLSMTMSVSQFFTLFPWDGQRAIAAPLSVTMPLPNTTEGADITLDDFSDLF